MCFLSPSLPVIIITHTNPIPVVSMTPPWFFFDVFLSTHSTCPTWPLPPAGFLPWRGTSRLHLLSWRVQGWAAASHRRCWAGGDGSGGVGVLQGPGPGMRLIYELINRLSVWVSKTAEMCEFFHVTVCAWWLSPLGKHWELSLPMLLSSSTCFQK